MDLTKVLSVVKSKKTGFFAAGVLFGTAGIKALSSKDAKKYLAGHLGYLKIANVNNLTKKIFY